VYEAFNKKLKPIQKSLASIVFEGKDLLYSLATHENAHLVRELYLLHVVNQIYKYILFTGYVTNSRTRDHIVANNVKLGAEGNPPVDDSAFQDQGFTRPSVLIILPTRNACLKVVNILMEHSGTIQQENKARFQKEYSLDEPETIPDSKPADFKDKFEGNDDDLFRIGIKFTRKSLKLFVEFYNADIILASPLGLKRVLESGTKRRDAKDGEEPARKKSKGKGDYDFLSSISLLIIDSFTHLQFQNWEHLTDILAHINLTPLSPPPKCDFSRVIPYFLDAEGKYHRQTLLLGEFMTAEAMGLFSSDMNNINGRVRIKRSYEGVLSDIGFRIKHSFLRIEAKTPLSDPDVRFNHFTTHTLRQITSAEQGGTLIFLPTYHSFLQLRNHLDTLGSPFGHISEYTPPQDLSRARSFFQSGKFPLILLTERAYFFRRFGRFRGVKRVVFYGLPEYADFYSEIVRWIDLEGGGDVKVLVSRWDWWRVERVVGTERVGRICAPEAEGGDVFEFY
jgi:U3 small nucleolar RNA-associated protein 25